MSDAFAAKSFSPAPVRFKLSKHGDHEFVIDGDPTVDQIGDMLRVDLAIRGGAESEEELANAALEGRDILLAMIQERQSDVTALRIGLKEITVIFSLIMRGSDTAAAVADSILRADSGEAVEDRSNAPEGAVAEPAEGEVESATPLASAKRSRARSSSSDELDAGLPATGTG